MYCPHGKASGPKQHPQPVCANPPLKVDLGHIMCSRTVDLESTVMTMYWPCPCSSQKHHAGSASIEWQTRDKLSHYQHRWLPFVRIYKCANTACSRVNQSLHLQPCPCTPSLFTCPSMSGALSVAPCTPWSGAGRAEIASG